MPPLTLSQPWQRVITDQDKCYLSAGFRSAVSQEATLHRSRLGTAPPLEAGSQKKFHAFLLHKSHQTNNHRETRPSHDYIRNAHKQHRGYVSKLRIYFLGGAEKEKSNKMCQCNRVKSILTDPLKAVFAFISVPECRKNNILFFTA